MIALYGLAALAGIGFGLLQAGWTAKMVASQDHKGRSALMLIGKLALWAAVMVALALYDPLCLVAFAAGAGASMVAASIAIWRKSRKDQEGGHSA